MSFDDVTEFQRGFKAGWDEAMRVFAALQSGGVESRHAGEPALALGGGSSPQDRVGSIAKAEVALGPLCKAAN